jgi:cytochrome c-type biogenesis protein CcmE
MGLDLSPREVEPAAPVAPRRRRWPAIVVLVLVLAAGGVVVTKFLTSAIDYYCNVDEVGAKSGCEAGRRLHVQGVVAQGTVQKNGAVTTFTIAYNGKSFPVRYEGDPGGIFQECIPVVVLGTFDGTTFHGDQLVVKHSNQYEAANAGRIAQANAQSAACKQPT